MKKITFIIPLLLCISIVGCSYTDTKSSSTKPFKRESPPVIDISNNNAVTNDCWYTGEDLTEAEKSNIPFMAIIENSKDARPQSGLSEADIVFETMAEGGIPRFIALFHKNTPKQIGPIRSARPYFLSIAEEYNLPFAHCGGSAEALLTIKTNPDIKSINEIVNGSYFYRDNSRKAPHNLYTSADKIRKYITSSNMKTDMVSNLSFDNSFWKKEDLTNATVVNFKLNNFYTTNYKFVNGKYEKYMDNVKAIDKNNNLSLSFTNIVVQQTPIKVQSDNLHLDINMIGKGTGYLFSNGKVEKIRWSRGSSNSQTELTTEDGNKVYLAKGNTIWHIIDNSVTPKYN
ncbi:DUF3048 domain-containing protein [Clostridium folliculivorans]|uniref:Lipoprotein YerB n=1 Tax=Clostridium folliculivorans TaxID=2886038 RepID=A0A9W6DB63_9CLOT|nr:DUF3048 domain-containing protein [Clostridium folliculivorans]GKU26100.1 hypothetical protein CFOLD11_29270 [Clostridium folliculivorans]GKU28186.1 hypothetical protein CFB3_02920 [Clostridium folliculivorans]